jgi:hypothetical protein
MTVKLLNDVRSKLAVSLNVNDTQVRVLAGHGVRFPTLSAPEDWFPLALENANGDIEYMRATARSGDIITVIRGQEGSTARGYPSGSLVELRLTVAALDARIERMIEEGGGTPVNNLTVASVSDGTVGA